MNIEDVITNARVNHREVKVLTVCNKDSLPKLLFATGKVVNLGEGEIKEKILALSLNDAFTMGRQGYASDLPLGNGRVYSRLHAAVLALGNGKYMVLDTSLSGTWISEVK